VSGWQLGLHCSCDISPHMTEVLPADEFNPYMALSCCHCCCVLEGYGSAAESVPMSGHLAGAGEKAAFAAKPGASAGGLADCCGAVGC
jgi:hypothetical protein